MPVKPRDESGFTMIMTVIGVTMVALVAAVAVTTVSGSAQQTGRSENGQQAYEAALASGAEIVHPVTTEPWGVRRFFVRDPDGNVVNVLSHA